MADDIRIDASDVTRAAADLGLMSAAAVRAIEPVMARAAHEIKTEVQNTFRQHRHFRGVANDVSYDRTGFLSRIGYEIGIEPGHSGKGHQGSLAGIALEGGANGGGGKVKLEPVYEHAERTLSLEIETALGML